MTESLISASDIGRAREIDQQVRHAGQRMTSDFLRLGDLMLEMESGLWKLLKDGRGEEYQTYEAWVRDALPKSRSLGFAAKRIVRQLGGVPRPQLERMGRDNLDLLGRLPEPKRTPEILAAAETLPYREFAAAIEAHAPEELIEAKRRLTFTCDLSQARVIEEIVELAAVHLADESYPLSREDALEMALVEWRNSTGNDN